MRDSAKAWNRSTPEGGSLKGVRMKALGDALAGRDNSLNFLRLVLASAVIVWHTYPVLGISPTWPASSIGTWAVNGFFALSGYLILGSRMRLDLRNYLVKRVARIYPGFWVALLVTAFAFAPLSAVVGGGEFSISGAIRYIARNITLWIGAQDIGETLSNARYPSAWNASLWTLIYEFGAYLIVGFVAAIPFVRRHLVWTCMVLLAATSTCVAMNVGYGFPSPLDLLIQAFRLWSFFAAGMVVYAIRERIRASWAVGAVSFAAMVVLAVFWHTGVQNWLGQIPFTLTLLWLGARLPIRWGARNDVSYGMYIYAFPVQQMLALTVGGMVPVWLFMALSAICTLPFAWGSWVFVERPVMRSRWVASQRSKPVLP